jgi:hypothetical protein
MLWVKKNVFEIYALNVNSYLLYIITTIKQESAQQSHATYTTEQAASRQQ